MKTPIKLSLFCVSLIASAIFATVQVQAATMTSVSVDQGEFSIENYKSSGTQATFVIASNEPLSGATIEKPSGFIANMTVLTGNTWRGTVNVDSPSDGYFNVIIRLTAADDGQVTTYDANNWLSY
jgi:hypothetical protein